MLSPEAMTPRQKALALIALVVALVLEIVDMTIVNTALPAIRTDLGAGTLASQWIVAGYALAFALLLLTGGRMGDSFGYRRMFLGGVAGFTLASMLCGAAQSPAQLVAARLLQGASGAVMAPQFMALMQVLFTPLERIARLATFGVIGGLAAIVGPIIGGLLIGADTFGLGWRLVFLINLPVGLLAFAMGLAFLPDARSSRPSGFDPVGITLFACALGALLWPLMHAPEDGVGALDIVLLAASLPLGWMGWRHVTTRVAAGRPALFDPSLFEVQAFRGGLALAIAFAAANAGFLLCFAFALQGERGQTPLVTGLLHVPFGIGTMIGIALIGRRLLPRLGKWVTVAGLATMAPCATLALLGIGELGLTWWQLVPILVGAGIGMGTSSAGITPMAVAQVDRDHAGAASGLLKTGQQAGSALGVALVGGCYFAAVSLGRHPGSTTALLALVPLLVLAGVLAMRMPDRIFAPRP